MGGVLAQTRLRKESSDVFLGMSHHGQCFPGQSEHSEHNFSEFCSVFNAYNGISYHKCTEFDQDPGFNLRAGTLLVEMLPFVHCLHRLRLRGIGDVWGRLRIISLVSCEI